MTVWRFLISSFLQRMIRIGLGVVFLASCAEKIKNPAAFADIITHYQLLPPALVTLTAIIFPWVELFCGLALIFGRFDRGAALLVCLMMAAFILIAAYNGYRGLNIACGCFSLSAKEPTHIAVNIARNLLILIPAAVLLLWPAPVWKTGDAA
ncbi:DoxX family membrane protein [Desulfosarcina sp. OttesenSCG-928-A07]|nr:DoxX family membrane protein [Desulfosarcina sp. OttesenSCG-928-G17]MDL2328866.1 DoxX family membrane protein [Desulfosarcina sp. OttesenSCG-928-A07]